MSRLLTQMAKDAASAQDRRPGCRPVDAKCGVTMRSETSSRCVRQSNLCVMIGG